MSAVSPETRNRNVVTFILLVLFALGLCAFVVVSMRIHNRRQQQNENVPAPPATSLWQQSRLSFAA